MFTGFLPTPGVITEILPLIDSKNPAFKSPTNGSDESKNLPPTENVQPTQELPTTLYLANADPEFINQLLHTIETLRKENARDKKLLKEAAETKAEDEKIKTRLKDENQKLIKEKNVTAAELAKCKRDLRTLRTKAIPATQKKVILREVMSKFGYTEKQLDCFVRGDWVRVKGWTDEDVKFALSLRTLSRKAYRWIRNKKLIPLPGESTLKRYMKNLQVAPGKTYCILHFSHKFLRPVYVNLFKFNIEFILIRIFFSKFV